MESFLSEALEQGRLEVERQEVKRRADDVRRKEMWQADGSLADWDEHGCDQVRRLTEACWNLHFLAIELAQP